MTKFVVTEAQAAMIRVTYEQRGEFSAVVELRQLFPGITDTALARECVRTIASWKLAQAAARRPSAAGRKRQRAGSAVEA